MRSNLLSYEPISFSAQVSVRSLRPHRGGDEGNRTLDPLLAGQVLSQLSYTPIFMGFFILFARSLKIEQLLQILNLFFLVSLRERFRILTFSLERR